MMQTALMKAWFRVWHGRPPRTPVERKGSGLVLMADGVGGLGLCAMSLSYALAAGRSPHALKAIDWGHGLGRWHRDLTDVANHRAQAEAMAAEVEVYRVRRPGAPVFLVGKSGGAGVAVRALEHLPEGMIESVVLLSPALSPRYDLSRALRAVRREMIVFWSPLDVVILGLGTRIFGTFDRVKSVGAGLVGFHPPKALGETGRVRYAKLRQVRWEPQMARVGYFGGHVGVDHPAFLARYVVPMLTVNRAEKIEAEPGSSGVRVAPIT